MRQPIVFTVIFLGIIQGIYGQKAPSPAWVDSVFRKMTLDDKIGQVFMIRAHSDLGEDHIRSVSAQIKKYKVGGLCFFQGTPAKQAALTAQYQRESEIPLMIAVDAEWGAGMRFKDKALSFPKQLMLGAIQNEAILEEMGYAIGKQLRTMGIHVNFAPVADINNNALNPVIGDRSFGEDRERVANHSIAYMKGLQTAGIMPCGKHFPGHGDTDMDSHYDLPVIPHSMERLREIELYPFQKLIVAGLPAMMVAHLHVPSIDSTAHISTTLSHNAVTRLLKNDMGFRGLVFTDALEMQGVAKHFDAGEVAIMAFEAGNDVLLMPADMTLAFSALKQAFKKGRLSTKDLDEKVRHILEAKYQLDLDSLMIPVPEQAAKIAFDPFAIGVKHKLIEEAITVVQNKRALIPLVNITEPRFATVAIGTASETPFQKRLDSYFNATHFNVPKSLANVDQTELIRELQKHQRVIISVHGMNSKASDTYGLTKEALGLIQNINRNQEVIVVVFGSPYSLKFFENIDHLIMAYEDTPETEDIAAQGLAGVFGFKGKLPVTASNIFPLHHGYSTPSLKRLGYSVPERVGMSSDSLTLIKTIATQMIRMKAAPGCQVLIAKDGRIIYEESFGKHTYKGSDSVRLSDLYDIASVTKVAATTPVIMRLVEEGKFSLDKTLGDYVPWLRNTNKEDMVIRKVLAHHAGLQSWIPFFESTLAQNRRPPFVFDEIYQPIPSAEYPVCVAEEMWMDLNYLDTIRRQIMRSGLNMEDTYVYSDLGFIMMPEVIRNLTGVTIERYTDSVFYSQLGLDRLLYKPLLKYSEKEIVPSEVDDYFRCQELDGYVHDMACAMLGGACGHAGLFSNAHDLAVFFQMLMNDGDYGGKRFIDSAILEEFTTRYKRSTRRGLGFDMKDKAPGKNLLMASDASYNTYGHTGFTGTCVWNDPDHNLIYIFLSNRTYPSMNNNTLSNYNFRERIHRRAYRAIQGYEGYTFELVSG